MKSYTQQNIHLYLRIDRGKAYSIAGKLRVLELWVEMHGGYVWQRSVRTQKLVWLQKSPWQGILKSRESIRIFNTYGPVECMRRLNENEYKKLTIWRTNLLNDFSKKDLSPRLPTNFREK
jgi:hypothetical protein